MIHQGPMDIDEIKCQMRKLEVLVPFAELTSAAGEWKVAGEEIMRLCDQIQVSISNGFKSGEEEFKLKQVLEKMPSTDRLLRAVEIALREPRIADAAPKIDYPSILRDGREKKE